MRGALTRLAIWPLVLLALLIEKLTGKTIFLRD